MLFDKMWSDLSSYVSLVTWTLKWDEINYTFSNETFPETVVFVSHVMREIFLSENEKISVKSEKKNMKILIFLFNVYAC